MSGVRTLARARAQARKLRRKLGDTYAAAEQERTAGVRADGLVDVAGQLYRAEGVTGNSGQTAVVNVARLAAAVYRPVQRTTVQVVGGGNAGSGGGGGGLVAHDLDGIYHTGTLSWAKVNKSGSDLADLETRQYASLTNRGHALVGGDHTASGLTTGHTLRATGATTFAWAQLQHGDLGGVTANQHHNQQHAIVGGDHTVTGAQWQIVGLTATNTLGLLTPSADPGAAAAILRTAADGSLNLADELLVADATQRNVWINSGNPDGSAALRVQAYANDDVTVHIKQKSGQTGRLWKVSDAAGQELIVLTNTGALQSGNPGFVSGLTGWQMTPEGRLEALDGWFRGELHASIFVMDEFHASGGTLVVAPAGPLENDAVIDSTTVQTLPFAIDTADVGGVAAFAIDTADVGGVAAFGIETVQNYLDITDPASGHAQIFSVGDTLRCKTFNGTGVYDLWLTVIGIEDQTDYYRYYVVKRSGTDVTLPAGSAVVSYGQTGDGRILLTSDQNYAPYLDVFTVGAEPWNGDLVPHTRLGRLDGVGVDGVGGVEQYGLIAGTDLSDNTAPYIVTSNTQVKLFKVDLAAYNGVNQTVALAASGVFKLGTGVANPATTAFSFDPVTGALVIGNASYPGSVTVYGSITVTGGNAATQTYANNAATAAGVAAVSTAGAYTDTVGATVQDYGSARRVIGVTDHIVANNTNTLTVYSSCYIRLANGTSKQLGATSLVAANSTVNYVYINITGSVPLTVSMTTNPLTLGGDIVTLGIFQVDSNGHGSYQSTIGATYIGSSSIVTGAIITDHLSANTVTAGKLSVSTISAINNGGAVNTGSLNVTGTLTMNTTGVIKSTGKDSYIDTTAGFFLGYDTNGSSAYKFVIGDADNYLKWSGATLELKTDEPVQLTIPSSGNFDSDFLYVARSGFTAKLSIDQLGSWRYTGFLRSRQDNGGDYWDILDWRNIQARTALSSLGSITANTSLAVHGNIVFDGAAPTVTMSVNPLTTFHDKVNVAYLRLTNQAQLYNAVTPPTEVTYGTYWEANGSGDGEDLRWFRIGGVVHLYGWVKRKASAAGQTVVATGLPAATNDVNFPARSSAPGIADTLEMQTSGTLVVNYADTLSSTPFNLMFNIAYRADGYDSFP